MKLWNRLHRRRLWDGAIPHQASDSGCSRPVVPISQDVRNEDLQGCAAVVQGWSPSQPINESTYTLVIWHSYWKLPFIVSFPIKNGDFSIVMLVYQKVSSTVGKRREMCNCQQSLQPVWAGNECCSQGVTALRLKVNVAVETTLQPPPPAPRERTRRRTKIKHKQENKQELVTWTRPRTTMNHVYWVNVLAACTLLRTIFIRLRIRAGTIPMSRIDIGSSKCISLLPCQCSAVDSNKIALEIHGDPLPCQRAR